MEAILAVLVGLIFAASLYLMMSRQIVRILIGVAMIGNGVNLLIFTAGRLTREVPPFIGAVASDGVAGLANPLPQALVLTAIVISFSFLAFLLVLGYRSNEELGTDDTNAMRVAEPAGEPGPPTGY